MAKKLIHKYTFTPATNTIVIPEIIKQNRFLLITNMTDNITIFTFNSATTGFSSYNIDTTAKTTTIVLDKDCSAMSSSDDLQIFVEQDKVPVSPSETYSDPVSKLRVSTPENLIDTDFEYGLQPSKWETLELVKNIPTFFSRDGDTGLVVTDVTTTNGSIDVAVTLESEHGFSSGAPIIVKSTRTNSCNGAFVVTATPTTTSFSYKAKQTQTFTGSIFDTYTEIYYGSVYQGTEFKLSALDAVTTDGATPSNLTASTDSATDFKEGTSFFLTNSLGTKNFTFDASTVDASLTKSGNKVYAIATDNTLTGRRRSNGFQTYAFTSKLSHQFLPSEVSLGSNNRIVINNHGLTDGMSYLWSSGVGNQFWNIAASNHGGGTLNVYREKIYYVRVDNANEFYLTETHPRISGGSTPIAIDGSKSKVDGGLWKLELMPAYKPQYLNSFGIQVWFDGDFHDGGAMSGYYHDRPSTYWQQAGQPPDYMFQSSTSFPNGMSDATGYNGSVTAATGDKRFWVRWWSDEGDTWSYAQGNGSGNEPTFRHNATTAQRNWYVTALGLRYHYASSNYYHRMSFFNYSNLTDTSHRYSGNNSAPSSSTNARGLFFIPVDFNSDYMKFYQTNHGLRNDEQYAIKTPISAGSYTDNTTSSTISIRPNGINHYSPTGGTTGDGGTNTTNYSSYIYRTTNVDTDGFYFTQAYNSTDTAIVPRGVYNLGTNFTLKPYYVRHTNAIATSLGHDPYTNPNNDSFKITLNNHGISDSEPLVYDADGNTVIGGLVDGTTYYATTTTQNKLRLSDGVVGVYPFGYNPNDGSTNTNQFSVYDVYTSTSTTYNGGYDRLRWYSQNNGLNNGDLIQYIERNGKIPGLVNGEFYYYRHYGGTNRYYFNLFYDKALALHDYTATPISGFDRYRPYGRIHIWRDETMSSSALKGEFRMTNIKQLTSAGSGTQKLQNTSVGGSDGVYTVNGVVNNSTYKLTSPGTIPTRTFNVVPINTVDLKNNAINYQNHGFVSGTSFTVDANNIGGLSTGTTYFAINVSKDWFKVAASAADATSNNEIDLTSVNSNSTGISTQSVAGQSLGDGTVSCESGSVRIEGTGTNFPSKYTVGDAFKIIVGQTLTAKAVSGLNANSFTSTGHGLEDGDPIKVNCTVAPSNLTNGNIVYAGNATGNNSFTVHPTSADAIANTNTITTSGGSGLSFDHLASLGGYEAGVIKYVNNITSLELNTVASQTLTDANYIIETSLLVRADGFALHRPYDGGVELVPSSNPDSQMIRQTRKYFRYQSGKGIQNSLAINFSPTTDIDTFSATGNTGTISTRYAHRLTDGLNVTVKGASVSSGINMYNNSLTIIDVPTENTFKVAFDTILTLNTNITLGEGAIVTQSTSGTTGIVRNAVSNSNTIHLHTVRTPAADVNVAVTVTNPSGSQNIFNLGGVANPADYSMTEGTKYIFNQDDASNDGHPMRISITRDGETLSAGVVYKLDGSEVPYSDWSNATTFNAATTRALEVTFASYSPIYYYACAIHSGMGNSIITPTAPTGTFTTNNVLGILYGDSTGVLNAYPTATTNAPADTIANGILGFTVDAWENSVLRAGMFDDQNGLFWEFNGSTLSCIVRSSTQQLSGFASATFKSTTITGSNTKFSTQINVGDRIIIKGQTYRVTEVASDTTLSIIPSYRGVTSNNIIITKTIDNKAPQNTWNIDKCDGTGPTSFVLDKTKIHMSYIDYSWYGAGKVRFGFKDQDGNVMYVHQFVHNNEETEAYMRSGNVPGRYEIENTGIPTYVPALAHWGTSVIMDGRFDNDKAYVFTAAGNNMTITGSEQLVVSGKFETTSPYYIRHSNYRYYYAGYGITVATANSEYNSLTSGIGFTGANAGSNNKTTNPSTYFLTPVQPYQAGARVSTSSSGYNSSVKNLILVQGLPTGVDSNNTNYTFTLSAGGGVSVTEPIPLISIRLAPSVDNGTPGLLGEREIINRMQLAMKQVGILSTHAAEIEIRLNGNIDNNDWQRVTVPSLSQLVYHSATDTVTGGNTIFSFRAQGGTGTSGRTGITTTQDLSEISDLGNSILGGDNVFPDGPDVVTIVARLVEDPSTVSASNPFQISGRVSWAESQA